ncbi:hypothetical protein EYY99_05210 [Hafnia alvei]|nr:hypothetical protein EYY99_05210 [Hafnia alvei]
MNNLIEQDHLDIKRMSRTMLEFKSFRRAQTLLNVRAYHPQTHLSVGCLINWHHDFC